MSKHLTMPLPTPSTTRTAQTRTATPSAWAQQWGKFTPRERAGVWLAAFLVGTALLWWGLLAPALSTLRQAPAQHAALDAQLQTMQALAERARALKAQPLISRDDSLRALEQATTRHLGQAGALKFAGDQATVTLPATSATTLATWLADVRSNARLTPTEARLTQVNPAQATWQGSVVFALNR